MLASHPYITQEVTSSPDDVVKPEEYVQNGKPSSVPRWAPDSSILTGDVQEFRYTRALQSAFLGGGIDQLKDLDGKGASIAQELLTVADHLYAGWVPASAANVFVVNHDTERVSYSLSLSLSSF